MQRWQNLQIIKINQLHEQPAITNKRKKQNIDSKDEPQRLNIVHSKDGHGYLKRRRVSRIVKTCQTCFASVGFQLVFVLL